MHIKASQYISLALKLVLSIALISCSQAKGSSVMSVLEESGDNRDELEGFLNHYPEHSQQHQAAEYTVVSMPGRIGRSGPGLDSLNSLFRLAPEFENKQFSGSFLDNAKKYASMPVSTLRDIDIISSDYLIENLEEAWQTYKQRQWNEKLTLEQFCEYILPGDKVIVEKVSTGARLFDFRKTYHGERTKIIRTPHWRKFKRNDILVFNFIHRDSRDSISMNWPVYYIKRCIGIPGDTVLIRDFTYIVNGDTLENFVKAKQMNRLFPSDSLAKAEKLKGYVVNGNDSVDNWTIRNYGPLLIPGKGLNLALDSISCRRYKKIIEWESRKNLTIENGVFLLDGKPVDEYEFKENYYFMAGDNVASSKDSRYWGLLPEEFIVGKARFVWWSEKNGRIRWNRILKSR